jgi:hypothetical protein
MGDEFSSRRKHIQEKLKGEVSCDGCGKTRKLTKEQDAAVAPDFYLCGDACLDKARAKGLV